MGLMLGVSVIGAAPKDIAAKCIDSGLLMLTAGSDAIRMLPPLTITYEEIDKGLAILKKVLEEVK
jgi:acetylornithine/N-succinyldiaminopimelate aminotransferase